MDEVTYIQTAPVLLSPYHNFVIIMAFFLLLLWLMKTLVYGRNIWNLFQAIKNRSLVSFEGRDIYRISRRNIMQFLRTQSSHISNKMKKFSLEYMFLEQTISIIGIPPILDDSLTKNRKILSYCIPKNIDLGQDDKFLIKGEILSKLSSLNLSIYIGLKRSAVSVAYKKSSMLINRNNKKYKKKSIVKFDNNDNIDNNDNNEILQNNNPDEIEMVNIKKKKILFDNNEYSVFNKSDYLGLYQINININKDKEIIVKNNDDNMISTYQEKFEINISNDIINKWNNSTDRKTRYPIILELHNRDISTSDNNNYGSNFIIFSYKFSRKKRHEELNKDIQSILSDMKVQESIMRDKEHFFNLKEVYGLEDNTTDCIVCMSEPADVIFFKCRHLCLCKYCLPKCSTCPQCRTPIENYCKFE